MPSLFGEIGYLDVQAIDDVLSVVEEGLVQSSERTRAESRSRQRELGVQLQGVGARFGTDESAEVRRQDAFTITSAAKATRLNSVLDDQGLVSTVFGSDSATWAGIVDGEFLECRVRTEIPSFYSFMNDAERYLRAVADFVPFLRAPGQRLSTVKGQLEGIRTAVTARRALPVIMYPSDADDSPRRFFGFLDAEAGVYDPRSITGPGIVLGRVRRVLRENQEVDLLKVGNLNLPSEKARTMVARIQGDPFPQDIRLDDLKMTAPAIELQVLVIAR